MLIGERSPRPRLPAGLSGAAPIAGAGPHWGGPLGHARDASRRSVEAPTSASAPLARHARGAEPGGSGSSPVGGPDPWAPGRV